MKLLITGGCGFLGSNLAAYGISNGLEVTLFDNLSRIGSEENLSWLRTLGKFNFIQGDTGDSEAVERLIRRGKFHACFHLAGQVAMTTSIADPRRDFYTNVCGAFNILDAIRKYSTQTAILFSSTNKVYGDLEQYQYTETATRYVCNDYPNGFNELVPLDFRSPYGCSKGAADQYILDFGRIYGLKTVVFRHSSMYGSRQFATSDQGWVGWFCKQALEKCYNPHAAPFTISGNGKQVRDILHAEDMISLYYGCLSKIDQVHAEAYNVGGTMDQSLSLLELFTLLEQMLNVKLEYTVQPPRISDQKVFVADIKKISSRLEWKPRISTEKGIEQMLKWQRGGK